jgi:branched-subunit amino acid ABC-type transport system permease component
MVSALGGDIPRRLMIVFGVGTKLGGVAGIMIAPIL